MESYVHKGVFRTKSNIYDGAFFTSVKPNFKNVLNVIAFRYHFLHNSFFREKVCNCGRKSRRKSLVNNRTIFIFEIRNYIMKWRHQ